MAIISQQQKDEVSAYINKLGETYQYNIERFDKQSLYISAGGIAVGLTIIKEFLRWGPADNIWMFFASLILFILSLVLSFFGYLITAEIIRFHIVIAKNFIQKGDIKKKIGDDKITTPLLYSTAGAIFLAIVFLSVFVLTNINNYQNSNKMTKTEKSINQKVGLNIKSLQDVGVVPTVISGGKTQSTTTSNTSKQKSGDKK
jgi:hypothetical protein